jgi:hypothetical protein
VSCSFKTEEEDGAFEVSVNSSAAVMTSIKLLSQCDAISFWFTAEQDGAVTL